MDFKSPSTKKKELDQKIESIGKEDSQVKDLPVAHKKAKVIPRPSDTEIDSFFDKLSKTNTSLQFYLSYQCIDGTVSPSSTNTGFFTSVNRTN